MTQPTNEAARLIISAQSVIADLTTQAAEVQRAIDRQQSVIDSLMPVAAWADEPVPDEEA